MRLKDLGNILMQFPNTEKMPVVFVGHGSPMNAIEENIFTKNWQRIGQLLPKPRAILCVSAHWLTRGTFVTGMERPKTIHDFYGFPKPLMEVEYAAPGSPELAEGFRSMLPFVGIDENEWGLDHGSWSVLKHIYPAADIPVVELSIDYSQSLDWHYALGQELQALRHKGVLIIGSGNITHNLRMVDWHSPNSGYDWAEAAEAKLLPLIADNQGEQLSNYTQLGREVQLAVPTPDHFIPMLYALGAREAAENVQFFNNQFVMGSLSMTSFLISDNANFSFN